MRELWNCDGARGLRAHLELDRALDIDLSQGIDIAIALDFSAPQPRHFGAPAATSRPFSVPGFSGRVGTGASCNCDIVTLIPHCNGTHTECVGHLTNERLDALRIVPIDLLAALVVSVTPVDAASSPESSEPAPLAGDRLITRESLESAFARSQRSAQLHAASRSQRNAPTAGKPPGGWPAQALVIRTLPNEPSKVSRDYSERVPPYLSRAAAEWLIEQRIEHLIVDLPSIDRTHDQGRLSAHRVFFGLPPHSRQLDQAQRRTATITELAYIPDSVADGAYLLQIQLPALAGDAVPSRPVLYRVS